MAVVGAISVAMLAGVLMLENRVQDAKATRTGTAHVESAAYLNSLQQMLSNQQFCTQNLNANMGQQTINYNPLNGSSLSQTKLTFNNLTSTASGEPSVTLAGQTTSQQMVLSNLVASEKPYIDLSKNFQYFGTQSTGAPGVVGNQCYGATLHADVDLETQTTLQQQQQPSGPRRSIGSQTVGADYPIVLMTNPGNQLAGCFLGIASSVCKPPAPPVITNWAPDNSCHDGWKTTAFTIQFAVSNAVSSTMTCTSSTGAPVVTNVTNQTSYSGNTVPNFIGCTLTAVNQVGDSVSQSTSLNFNSNECDTSSIQLTNVPACVNAGQGFTVNWSDGANDLNDLITLNFNATPLQTYTTSVTPHSGTANFTAPSTPVASLMITANDNDVQGDGGGATASVQVKATPTVSSFSVNPLSYDADHIPANVTLSWTTSGVDSVDLNNGGGTSLPANSAQSIGAPTTTTTYTLTAHGGCTGTPDATSSVTVTVTPCSCDPTVAAATPLGQAFNDSCGQPKCTGQEPAPACPMVTNSVSYQIGPSNCGPINNVNNNNNWTWESTITGQWRQAGGSGDHPAGKAMPPFMCSNYFLSVPADAAAIQGVEVDWADSSDNGVSVLQSITLMNNSTVLGTKTLNLRLNNKSNPGEAIIHTGGSTDLWGATLTPAIITGGGFQVDFQYIDNGDRMYFFDGQSGQPTPQGVTVWYTVPATPPPSCGSASMVYYTSPPTSNLCGDGSTPVVSGSGPYTWQCPANCDGGPVNCQSNPTAPPPVPACETAGGFCSNTCPTSPSPMVRFLCSQSAATGCGTDAFCVHETVP